MWRKKKREKKNTKLKRVMARDGIYGESAHGLKIGVARYKSVLVGQNGRSKGGCRDFILRFTNDL